MFYVESGLELGCLLVYKLASVVDNDGMQHFIPTYYVLPNEVLDLLGCDGS